MCRRRSRAPSRKGAKEMIVVLPDSKTVYNGSMYSSSVTTGDFENFVARDVVAYIDAHYRTIPKRTSRGLVGHSMGGYGASRIGMKHSDVFGSLYIMSPCCMSAARRWGGAETRQRARRQHGSRWRRRPRMRPRCPACALSLRRPPRGPRILRSRRCISICRIKEEAQQEVLEEVGCQRALGVRRPVHRQSEAVPRHRHGCGRPGWFTIDAGKLHDILDSYGIANTFEIYPGTHTSAVAVRFQNTSCRSSPRICAPARTVSSRMRQSPGTAPRLFR